MEMRSIYKPAAAIFLMIALLAALLSSCKFIKAESFEPKTVRGVNTTNIPTIERANDFKANALRFYLRPNYMAKKHNVSLKEGWRIALTSLDKFMKKASRYKMMVIIDLHEVPSPSSDNFQRSPAFWTDTKNLQTIIDCWREIVQRYASYKDYIWGYELLNEPNYDKGVWPTWAEQVIKEIRKSDKVTPVIFEPSPVADPSAFGKEGMKPFKDSKVIYSFHMYQPLKYTHQGIAAHNNAPVNTTWPDQYIYPGKVDNTYWNKDQLRRTLQPVRDFQTKYRVPIFVGEFGAIRWAEGSAQYIRDNIDIFEEYGWSWAFHAFADWHGWDVNYNAVMTSDANAQSALVTEPTDRALVLKQYFERNE